jgi:hypothetical protein
LIHFTEFVKLQTAYLYYKNNLYIVRENYPVL